jgi:hypothetical protein
MFDVNYDDNYDTVLNRIIDHNNYSGTGDSGGAGSDGNNGCNGGDNVGGDDEDDSSGANDEDGNDDNSDEIEDEIVILMRLNRFGYESLIIKNYCYASPMLYTCIMLPTCIRNLVWFHITRE